MENSWQAGEVKMPQGHTSERTGIKQTQLGGTACFSDEFKHGIPGDQALHVVYSSTMATSSHSFSLGTLRRLFEEWRHLGQLPLVFSLLNHIINCLLSNLESLDASWYAAVDGSMENGLTDLNLGETVVQGATDVDTQLWPALEGNQHANV